MHPIKAEKLNTTFKNLASKIKPEMPDKTLPKKVDFVKSSHLDSLANYNKADIKINSKDLIEDLFLYISNITRKNTLSHEEKIKLLDKLYLITTKKPQETEGLAKVLAKIAKNEENKNLDNSGFLYSVSIKLLRKVPYSLRSKKYEKTLSQIVKDSIKVYEKDNDKMHVIGRLFFLAKINHNNYNLSEFLKINKKLSEELKYVINNYDEAKKNYRTIKKEMPTIKEVKKMLVDVEVNLGNIDFYKDKKNPRVIKKCKQHNQRAKKLYEELGMPDRQYDMFNQNYRLEKYF